MVKKYMNLTFVLLLATVSVISANPLEIEDVLTAPHISGSVKVIHENNRFSVIQGDVCHAVENYWVDKNIRNIDSDKLRTFLEHGYIAINQLDKGEFSLTGKLRLKGSGPVAASIAYWLTKSVCYGTAVAAAGTVVVATGGAAGAATSALAAAGTLGAGTGTSLAGAAIAGAGLTEVAVATTTGVITSAGTLAGAITAVESASAGVAAFFLVLPIP
jgi:hypothetical protein